MNKLALFAFVGTVVVTSACAHAAPAVNICPAGTKTATLLQPLPDSEFPVQLPPDTGAYGESTVQTWDISGTPGKFKVACNPEEVGFKGQTTPDVPAGSTSCAFDTVTGIFTCQH